MKEEVFKATGFKYFLFFISIFNDILDDFLIYIFI